MRRSMSAVWLGLILSGCINTSAVKLGSLVQFPPVEPADVQVFQKEDDVTGKYDKVALITAEGNYSYANDERMVKAMKKKAGKLGANAIVLGEFKDPSTAGKVANAIVGVGGEKKGHVLAIRIR